jgi:regulator of replication initiation timing
MPGLGTPVRGPRRLEISEVIRIVNLIKKVNCQNYALITETASELGEKKTSLMQFIEDNPKLFALIEVEKPKKGLAIKFAYDSAEQNPATDEWIEVKKEEWKNKIKVSEMTYYGCHEFYYLAVDEPKNNSLREHLWRNTPEKIKTLLDAGAIKMQKSGYGGLSDYYSWEGLLLTKESENLIKELGWELVYPPKE